MMSRCHQSVLLCIVCDRVLAEGVPPLRNQKCRAWARVLGGDTCHQGIDFLGRILTNTKVSRDYSERILMVMPK